MAHRTLYDTFNARFLSPREVSKTFVFSSDFAVLCENCHTIVMGPRGSGKTTLFKMLTPEALHFWVAEEADEMRAATAFTAIYIPSDIHWERQLVHLSDRLQNFPAVSARASEAAVASNVLTSVCETFSSLLLLNDKRQDTRQSELAKALIEEWRLPPTLPDLDAVYCGLQSRASDLVIQTRRAIDEATGSNKEPVASLPDYFRLDYLFAANAACAAFERLFPEIPARKWALCFDELELTPGWLQTRLFAELRSTHQRFLFKLSTSPIPNLAIQTIASPRNDIGLIRLWRHAGHSVREFSEKLTKATFIRRGVGEADPLAILGHSIIASDDTVPGEYEPGSPAWTVLREESQTDPSLRDLLRSRGVSPSNPTASSTKIRDELLRKIKPTAFLRNAFRKMKRGSAPVGRSRKLVRLYSGAEVVYDVTDGNPRWLVGIVNDLVDALTVEGAARRISDTAQARVLREASYNYGSLVRAFPGPSVTVAGRPQHMFHVLKMVADYFHSRIVFGNFPLDPVGTFIVDSRVPDDMLELLRQAAYYGAIVNVDPEANSLNTSLRGKRFRLTFLLSPAWKLPLRVYDGVALSSCLRGGEAAEDASPQRPLPFEES